MPTDAPADQDPRLDLRAKVAELGRRRSDLWTAVEAEGPTARLLLLIDELQDEAIAVLLEEIENLRARVRQLEFCRDCSGGTAPASATSQGIDPAQD
jgi:hypothetical protein